MQRFGNRAAVAGAVVTALALAGCSAVNEPAGIGSRGTIEGAGASSQAAAMNAWTASFVREHPGIRVSYAPIGSGGGRERFIAGATDFGGTDAVLDRRELAAAEQRCHGQVIEMPAYISPIALPYNLPGIEHLRLSPELIAKIFAGQITNWSHPAIAAQNPGVDLPDLRITPVHRSDESGTTENFLDYLSVAAGQAWPYGVSGEWPIPGGEAAQGNAGVVAAVDLGRGTIGYAVPSLIGDLPVVAVEVGDEYVRPTPEAAAKVVQISPQAGMGGPYVFAYDLARDTSASGAYPIVLVSYLLACGNYESARTAELVRTFLGYVISDEGQRIAAEYAGSAPLSDALQRRFRPAIQAISGPGGRS